MSQHVSHHFCSFWKIITLILYSERQLASLQTSVLETWTCYMPCTHCWSRDCLDCSNSFNWTWVVQIERRGRGASEKNPHDAPIKCALPDVIWCDWKYTLFMHTFEGVLCQRASECASAQVLPYCSWWWTGHDNFVAVLAFALMSFQSRVLLRQPM